MEEMDQNLEEWTSFRRIRLFCEETDQILNETKEILEYQISFYRMGQILQNTKKNILMSKCNTSCFELSNYKGSIFVLSL